MKDESDATVLTMKKLVFCSNMIKELGFDTLFDNVPVYIDNISTLHVACNQTNSLRVKHVVLLFFFIQALVKHRKISIHDAKTED